MRIMITAASKFLSDPEIYSHGYTQNILFLYRVMEELGHSVFLLTDTNDTIRVKGNSYRSVKLILPPVDVVIEAGVVLSDEQRDVAKRTGAKIIAVRYGASLVMDMESMVYGIDTITPGLHRQGCDAVWTSPHLYYQRDYLAEIYQAPCYIAPYVWEPDFVELDFNDRPYPKRPNLIVMEPSISVLKNSLIPLAIINRVWREAPDSFDKVYIVNGAHYHDRPAYLDNVVRNLPVARAENGKVFYTPRHKMSEVFKQRDVLVGNQVLCDYNYLYLEAMKAGIPVLTNSSMTNFTYDGFKVEAAADELLRWLESGVYPETKDYALDRYSIQATAAGYRDLLSRCTREH